MRALRLAAWTALAGTLPLAAQTNSIGTVAVSDATVTGDLSVTSGRAMLLGSNNVVARDHTAEIALSRGGSVRVCATSALHLAQAQGSGAHPLMLALDHGAIEVQTNALASDVVMTPDLRFTTRSAGPLDLRLRVTRDGDTCVENRGVQAPVLGIADQFGEGSYELLPGQHVLFEHGSLKEVVDNESSPCGCPAPAAEQGTSIADALLAAHRNEPQTKAAAEHPFPAAVSEGLAPAPPVPQAAPGTPHAQVSTTLGYTGEGAGTISGNPAKGTAAASAAITSSQPSATPGTQRGFFHRVGHFFKHLFGG